MSAFGFLIIISVVAVAGFLIGQLSQSKGHCTLSEIDRYVPSDMQTAVRIVLTIITAGAGFFVLVAALESGPQAFFPFLFMCTWLLTTAWVYLDAKARGGRAKAWAMLTFFTFVFGLCGYLITRPDRPRTCPRCMYRLRDEFVVCPYCGPQAGLNCPSCQSALEPAWRYCPYCQADVNMEEGGLGGPGPFMSMEESPLSPPQIGSAPTYPT